MCGVAGIVNGGPNAAARVDAMLRALSHRGPDGVAQASPAGVHLGHVRLAIRDLTHAGAQPAVSHDGRWTLAFNGEIFNDAELRASLAAPPIAGGDTTVLLETLADRGIGVLPECNGFFALAAVDAAQRMLYLARDRFGVKPLYVARHGGALLFASEVRALLAAGVPRRPNLDGLRRAVAAAWLNGRQTLIEGIERVSPGTWLSIDLDTLSVRETVWYEPGMSVDAELAAELERLPRAVVAERVAGALQASVARRLESRVPAAVLCSGGIDSSAILQMANRVRRTPAYVGSIPDDDADELPFARLVAEAAGAPLRVVSVDRETWRTAFVEAVQHFDYPLVHESSIALSLIGRAASADGVRVLLSGEAADELFGGYGSRHLQERAAFAGEASAGGPAALNAAEVESITAAASAYRHHEGARRALEAALLSDLRNFLPHGLNRLDKNLMQSAVEVREPFLDPEVVRLAVNLPLELRIAPRLKGVLLDAVAPLIPRAILERPKVGFSFDVARLLHDGSASFLHDGLLLDLLAIPSAERTPFVAALKGRALFRMIAAEAWARLNLREETAEEVGEALRGARGRQRGAATA